MSWPRKGGVGALSRTVRQAAVWGMLGAGTVLLAGCGFQPLYGPTASGEDLAEVMKSVDVSTVPGRVGQRIRNELIFRTTGGGYAADKPKYRLDIAIKESVMFTLVNQRGDPQGSIYQLYSEFKLVRLSDNKVVVDAHTNGRAAYDKVESVFNDIRAKRDAEDRASRTVSEAIRTRIAAYLATNA
jgi:LPS-assembly lipoprotein